MTPESDFGLLADELGRPYVSALHLDGWEAPVGPPELIRHRIDWPDLSHTRRVRPRSDLLERFVSLATASDQQILRFSARWGQLGLCRHGLSANHTGRDECGGMLERVRHWRMWASAFAACIRLSAMLRYGEAPSGNDWLPVMRLRLRGGIATVTRGVRNFGRRRRNVTTDAEKQLDRYATVIRDGVFNFHKNPAQLQKVVLGDFVTWCFQDARIAPGLVWNGSFPQLQLLAPKNTPGLFVVLTAQLLGLMLGSRPVLECSNCRELFTPQNLPKTGTRRYCEHCRIQARWRDAQRARRARLKKTPERRTRSSLKQTSRKRLR